MVPIVKKTISATSADGLDFEMVISICGPECRESHWTCGVSITSLVERPRELVGVDSWQSLQIAQQLVLKLLSDFVGNGGRLFHYRYGPALVPAELFVSAHLTKT